MASTMVLALASVTLSMARAAQRAQVDMSLHQRVPDFTKGATGVLGKPSKVVASLGSSKFLQVSAESKPQINLDIMPVWKEYDLFDRPFFVNALTGEKQWTTPSNLGNSAPASFVKLMARARHVDTRASQDLIASSKSFETRPYQRMSRKVGSMDITLAFQGDISRLRHLREVAHTWQGPISASILVLEADIPKIAKLVESSNAFKINVDLNLCVAKQQWTYYPVNSLRNHAIRHARTDYLFVMDGDEDPVQHMDAFKKDLYKSLVATKADPKKTAFIVTSWQWGNKSRLVSEYPKTKEDLARLRKSGKVICKAADFPQAYKPLGVDLQVWMNADIPKEIPWHDRYEPYMVVHKDTLGTFDERFVGWGGNKAIHILKMQLQKVNLVLLPHVFTFTDQSIVKDNAKGHTLPADPDLPERAARELGHKFGCNNCTYKECVKNCLDGFTVTAKV